VDAKLHNSIEVNKMWGTQKSKPNVTMGPFDTNEYMLFIRIILLTYQPFIFSI